MNKDNSGIVNDEEELESQTLKGRKPNGKPPSGEDPIADWLLKSYYKLNQNNMKAFKLCVLLSPLLLILLFT